MKILNCFILALLLSFFSLKADEFQTIQQVDRLLKENHSPKSEKVWPQFDLTSSPVMITFKNGHIYAFHLKSQNPQWKKIEVNGTPVLFSEIDHWGISGSAMNPQFPIEGQMAYVFNLDNSSMDIQKLFEILVHERFHRYQFDHFPMDQMKGSYTEDMNIGNLTLMQMEEMALAQFFQAAGNPELQKEYLLDFAAINQTRRAMLKKLL